MCATRAVPLGAGPVVDRTESIETLRGQCDGGVRLNDVPFTRYRQDAAGP